eukprot:TRINITY_DN80668_c0_g1_i1.p2 TRINITY_DN80668_c0_g1~~TRINITY_DN80668_c0_g1_i1.p2  ORF type:complete len:129 (-),score=7.17 TRINITY_DN80668_c0_g1_i1:356-742(-)
MLVRLAWIPKPAQALLDEVKVMVTPGTRGLFHFKTNSPEHCISDVMHHADGARATIRTYPPLSHYSLPAVSKKVGDVCIQPCSAHVLQRQRLQPECQIQVTGLRCSVQFEPVEFHLPGMRIWPSMSPH